MTALDFSIILCTHNPDERLLKKVLNAISDLDCSGLQVEYLLVDNNSNPPLEKQKVVTSFLGKHTQARCLLAEKQGLLWARLLGVETAKGSTLVFFDDDNVPSPCYLQNLVKLQADFPQVGAWGPGKVQVELQGTPDPILEDEKTRKYALKYFQQLDQKNIQYSSSMEWQDSYPYGTGICIRRKYLLDYKEKVEMGAYRAIGRRGTSLSSGEDLQMVLSCIAQGAAAGRSPSLQVSHLITPERTNFAYLKRLIWGTNLAFYPSTCAVFPALKEPLLKRPVSAFRFQRKALTKYLKAMLFPHPVKTLELIRYLAVTCGAFQVCNRKIPNAVTRMVKTLGIQSPELLRSL